MLFSNQPICTFHPPLEATPKALSLVNVQRRLLQCHVPDFDNVECSVMYRPAEIVGGDFYDVLRLPTGELGIGIGDVSGKGLEAALMMATVQATLRAEVGHAADIGAALARVNDLFHEASLEHCYATLFYAVLDPVSSQKQAGTLKTLHLQLTECGFFQFGGRQFQVPAGAR